MVSFATRETPVIAASQKIEVDEPLTSAEAMRITNCDWKVSRKPIMYQVQDPNGETTIAGSNDHFAIVRSDNSKCLGTVGSRYKEVQNEDAFSFMDSLSEEGKVRYKSVLVMNEGARIMLFADIPGFRFEPVKNDEVSGHAMLFLSHDGTGSINVGPWTKRYACANLCPALKASVKRGAGISIRHSGDIKSKLREAQKVLAQTNQELSAFKDMCTWLANQSITQSYLDTFMDELIPLPEGKSQTRAKNKRSEILHLVESGAGTDIPGVRGTRWGLLNAVTEYTNHGNTTRSRQSVAESLIQGSNNTMNSKAIGILTQELVAA